jgi:hypothetical protein
MTDGTTDNTSDRRTTEGANPSAFFPRRKWAARTAGTKQCDCYNERQSSPAPHESVVFHDCLLQEFTLMRHRYRLSVLSKFSLFISLMSKQRTSPKRKKTEDSFNNSS